MHTTKISPEAVLGKNIRVYDFVNIYGACEIGDECVIGAFVEIQPGVRIGRRVKISSHTFVCEGVTIDDEAFVGHGVMFTNDKHPKSVFEDGTPVTAASATVIPTHVGRRASIGSGATILCGITIGEGALVGAGSVVTKDVSPHTVVKGNPATVHMAAPAHSGAAGKGIPYVDYYSEHNISPVSQDVSDRQKHFRRRAGLYRQLGIAPGLLRDKTVLEFGPGSGHNALYTLSLGPRRYDFVEANATGLARTRELLAVQHSATKLHYEQSLLQEYACDRKYDLVICEGLLPLQINPGDMLRHVSSFVDKGGIVVCTCADCVSCLSDCIRRVLGQACADASLTLFEQAEKLVPMFVAHFNSLPGMSRPVVDWILDNVLQPFHGWFFSIGDAAQAIGEDFEVLGASPHFYTDWRWYKDLTQRNSGSAKLLRQQWLENLHNLVDYSLVCPPRPCEENAGLYACAERFAKLCFEFQSHRDDSLLEAMASHVGAAADLMEAIGGRAVGVAEKLRDGAAALRTVMKHKYRTDCGTFASLFGRGQQYISFVRK